MASYETALTNRARIGRSATYAWETPLFFCQLTARLEAQRNPCFSKMSIVSMSCYLRPNPWTAGPKTLAVGYALPGSDPFGAHVSALVPKC